MTSSRAPQLLYQPSRKSRQTLLQSSNQNPGASDCRILTTNARPRRAVYNRKTTSGDSFHPWLTWSSRILAALTLSVRPESGESLPNLSSQTNSCHAVAVLEGLIWKRTTVQVRIGHATHATYLGRWTICGFASYLNVNGTVLLVLYPHPSNLSTWMLP